MGMRCKMAVDKRRGRKDDMDYSGRLGTVGGYVRIKTFHVMHNHQRS